MNNKPQPCDGIHLARGASLALLVLRVQGKTHNQYQGYTMNIKRLLGVIAGIPLIIGVCPAQATSISIPFTYLYGGAVSYSSDTSKNVVVDGTAFTGALPTYGLGTQMIVGDGIDLRVSGNFGMVAAVAYDPTGDMAWAMAHPNQTVNFAIRLEDFTLDFGNDVTLKDSFRLNGEGLSWGLEASFAELATPGYTEVGPDIWMDVILDPTQNNMAISVVMNYALDPKYGNGFEATLQAGAVGGPVPGYRVGSGITGETVPEAASTLLLLGLGLIGLTGFGKKVRV